MRSGARIQTNRVELNAMTTPQFIEWLDDKMAEHGSGKLIPPPDVLEAELAKRFEAKVRADLTAQILLEAGFEHRVADIIAGTKTPKASTLKKDIRELFDDDPERQWRDHIDAVVAELKFRKVVSKLNRGEFLKEGILTRVSELIHRNTGTAIFGDGCCLRQSVIGAEEETMTTAGQALLWTGIFFCLSFAGIFAFWFAERLKSRPLRKL
jgi:hypothetical protein